MVCPNCGASVRLDRDQNVMICDYCHSQSAPPVDENGYQITGETGCPCPVCSTKLSNARVELRDLLYCTACYGTLVSMDHFMSLIDDLRDHRDRGVASHLNASPGAVSHGGLNCPLCGRAMNHHAHGGGESGDIMIDSCETCAQIWLDRGTLAKLVGTPAGESWTEPQQRETESDPRAELARRVADLALLLKNYSGRR